MKLGAIFFCALAFAVGGALGWVNGGAVALAQLKTLDGTGATLFAGYIAAALALIAAIIAVWGVYSQRVLARRQATIAHIAALQADGSVQKTISEFIALTRGAKNLGIYADGDHVGGTEQFTIIAVLNQYELISTGIQRGIFEYELIKQFHSSSLQRYWTAAHPFVVALRQRVGVPTLWCEFEKLNGWVTGQRSPLLTLWWTGFA